MYVASTVTGATYAWTVPAGIKIDSTGKYVNGNDTIQVTITNTFLAGSISVQAQFSCGLGKVKALALKKTAPKGPKTITGPTAVCAFVNTNNDQTYTCSFAAATTYYN